MTAQLQLGRCLTYGIQAHLTSGGTSASTSGGEPQTHMLVDLQDNSADGSTQMDLDLDSEELAAIPVSSDHDESLPLLPPLPPIPPQLTQSGRPQRNYRLPKRFQDNLPRPEAPLPAVKTEPPNSETATHTGIRRVTLIV